MLRRLEIESYGLIDRAEIDFGEGATIFTGETGSGKTMVVGALDFVLGARGGADVVRRGATRASVTLWFEPNDALRRQFAGDGFPVDAGETATVAREMADGGRSAVRVNGRAATAGYVRDLADTIAEIVGQHEAQRLLAAPYHRELLDAFGGAALEDARHAVTAAYARVNECSHALGEMRAGERRDRDRYDDAAFALEEIERARVRPGESAELRERRRYLESAADVTEALSRAGECLSGDGGAVSALGAAAAALHGVSGIGQRFAAMADAASALQSQANDLAAELAGTYDDDLDPSELDTVNARLDVLERLERKYGDGEALAAHADAARETVESYRSRESRERDLLAQSEAATRELQVAAAALTALRSKAAGKLERAVQKELSGVALGSGRFHAALESLEAVGPEGAERVDFRFAANAGEPERPLARAASGGELSRLLLALVVVLAGARKTSAAMVFDEIDAGIGGATATAVGARLERLAASEQVICITHLAQIAACGQRHYVLEKSESSGTTTIAVRELVDTDARTEELARMLSGEKHEIALQHARTLLESRH